ncbi:MAG: acetyl-CoA carboxylase carboxyltransferase subunit alpha [Candidatus Margulisbacteria bacterium]|nr:acetyl-CoA carboxylase carboxyltransferase subunit alpha [Candidatus Margulisiibacteriota bacterium]
MIIKPLEFEKPIHDLYIKIDELKRLSQEGQVDLAQEIKKIETRAKTLKKEIFAHLTPQQILQIARHPNRPDSFSLANLICDDFIELHGDRHFRDDPSMIGGMGQIASHRVVIIGHQKGHDTKENIYRNFGMPHPEGYRKALRLMKLAEKFGLPIVTFIDTPGAYPGLGAEERGQSEAIARNLKEMTGIHVPIFSVVVGEGGSGGALGIGVANRIYMLEHSVYSVISPEGCASILFRDTDKADIAAEQLKLTAKDILELGVIDGIVKEPLGGGHHDWHCQAENIKKVILKDLASYKRKDTKEITEERYEKFRSFGKFMDESKTIKKGD